MQGIGLIDLSTGKPFGTQNNPGFIQLTGRNAPLPTQSYPTYISKQTVAAGASYSGAVLDVDGYQDIVAGYAGASSGDTSLYLIDASADASQLNATILSSSTANSASSNPVAVTCPSGWVRVVNNSATAQTLSVSVYVR